MQVILAFSLSILLTIRLTYVVWLRSLLIELHKDSIQFFHFSNPLLMLVCLARHYFHHFRTRLVPAAFAYNIINRLRINIVTEWRRIQFFQPVLNFFLLSKLQEVLESRPLFVLLINRECSSPLVNLSELMHLLLPTSLLGFNSYIIALLIADLP
jgi:hypothetical protein